MTAAGEARHVAGPASEAGKCHVAERMAKRSSFRPRAVSGGGGLWRAARNWQRPARAPAVRRRGWHDAGVLSRTIRQTGSARVCSQLHRREYLAHRHLRRLAPPPRLRPPSPSRRRKRTSNRRSLPMAAGSPLRTRVRERGRSGFRISMAPMPSNSHRSGRRPGTGVPHWSPDGRRLCSRPMRRVSSTFSSSRQGAASRATSRRIRRWSTCQAFRAMGSGSTSAQPGAASIRYGKSQCRVESRSR